MWQVKGITERDNLPLSEEIEPLNVKLFTLVVQFIMIRKSW